ncbi:TIGR00730 family Rossman fold protein [Micromonospora sp. KC606]|uniref:LOG family protein n=1 Tax=Micromonospora sp. KC606 TaxID=2530379 RepID=UPI00104F2C8C|nr:TIGR00730 family Rossman fold protein [Micromonospora sp. KC606]TDC78445.1 TIGR00730 family Rossman fold protein [Micromonospora sp. KC606]
MRYICVFTGSSHGCQPTYMDIARRTGAGLAQRGITVIYGGARIGTMGAVADGALGAGGRVVGVLPRGLAEWDVAHHGLTELHLVADMHERKAMMAARADAFIALPGGSGTLEELFEVWTWAQLGLHTKPIGLLDAAGFYAPLAAFLEHSVREGFLKQPYREMLIIEPTLDRLLERFANYQPPDYTWSDDAVTEKEGIVSHAVE